MTNLCSRLITSVFLLWGVVYFANCSVKKSSLEYQVFYTQNGWGYDILVRGRTIIHQDVVPTLATNRGFTTQKTAIEAAKLVISKIKLKKPPVLTSLEVQELISAR